jgi:hypothetical protein
MREHTPTKKSSQAQAQAQAQAHAHAHATGTRNRHRHRYTHRHKHRHRHRHTHTHAHTPAVADASTHALNAQNSRQWLLCSADPSEHVVPWSRCGPSRINGPPGAYVARDAPCRMRRTYRSRDYPYPNCDHPYRCRDYPYPYCDFPYRSRDLRRWDGLYEPGAHESDAAGPCGACTRPMSPAKYIQPKESAGRKWKPLLFVERARRRRVRACVRACRKARVGC